jgi:S-(hydroxymethyl)glutathione dehydrogenase/alcohol dehydrogenase
MAKRGKAVVARELNKPVQVEDVQFDAPKAGEVLVKIAAVGVCHSDLSATNGTIALPMPLILGHEAAGEVVEVGDGVAELKAGDHVVSNWIYMCGRCHYCNVGRPVLCNLQGKALSTLPDGTLRTRDAQGKPLNIFSGVGVMAEYAVVHADNLVKIDPAVPLDRAALVGCAVTTGVGAVFNTAKVEPGANVVVFGLGGIGLNVVQGARMVGANMIVGVDLNPARESLARKFGLTHFVNPKDLEDDLVAHLVELTGGGADYSFECVGNVQLMRQALECCHRGWGVSVIIGVAGAGQEISTRPFQLVTGRVWKGTAFGGARGRSDVPKIVDWYMDGRINIDDLITHTLPLADINKAFDLMHAGTSIRSVVVY